MATRIFAVALLLLLQLTAEAQTVRYIHTDALGSVVAVTDANRNVVERREYEPYGVMLTGARDGPGYTGHVTDVQTSLSYMQQRYYDPSIGRFLSVDPVAADTGNGWNFNRYNYAANNPYKFKDPDGRIIDTIWDVGSVIYDLGKAAYGGITGDDTLVREGLTDAAIDTASAAIPFVPAGLSKGARMAERAADAGRAADRASDGGRAANKLKPDPAAVGPHTTFKRDADGNLTNYATYRENPQNPTGFQVEKRVDVAGKGHTNPDGNIVETPHVKEGSDRYVRPARPEELPRR